MRLSFAIIFTLLSVVRLPAHAEDPQSDSSKQPLRLGVVASLSSFAAHYGSAVVNGVKLAVEEEKAKGRAVELFVEDDASETKNTVSAYKKLRSVNHIDALIGGTWWANSVVKLTEHDNVPFLSAETTFDKDSVRANNYFIMLGNLTDWVNAFEPVVNKEGFKRGATLRFASGFGATLSEAMENLFSEHGRQYAGTVEYSDVEASDASSLAMKVKKLNPEVLYIDAQPGSFATIVKKLYEAGLKDLVIFSNVIAKDAFDQKLLDPSGIGRLYYSMRATTSESLRKKLEARYPSAPLLNADVGYYSARLAMQAFGGSDPISRLSSSMMTVDGIPFVFDEKNVYRGVAQEIWEVRSGKISRFGG